MSTYSDAVFHVNSLEDAKRIILTPEGGLSTEARWADETAFLRERMLELFPADGLLLDFGCGIGRLAKAWLEKRPDGRILGVDLSQEMRQLAPGYVANDRFAACSPDFYDRLLADGVRFDGAVACWIIQHVLDAAAEIEALRTALKPGARLLVINNLTRAVPTDQGWIDDGFDVASALAQRFTLESMGKLPERATSAIVSSNTFLAVYRRPKD